MSLVVPLEEVFANKTGLLANHESWERIELGAICTILNGFPFKSNLFNKSKGFPVIRIRDIARSATETFYDGDFPSEYIVRKGDLLIGMDGNFRCFEWQGCEAGLNQRVCKITADERILLRKFLLYGLNGYLKAIEDVTSSVTVGHLSSRDIQQIPFPLPSLAEQKRIVAKLEKVLEKVDASRARLDKIPTLLKRFRQSVLAAACSGKLTADWREQRGLDDECSLVPLRELCDSFNYGTSAKSQPAGKVPVLRMGNIQDGEIDWTNLVFTSGKEEINKYALKPKTVLFNRTNSPELVGKTAIYRGERPAIFAGYLIRINPRENLDPEYLNYCLNTSYAKEYYSQVKTDGVSQSNINAQKLADFELPYCPLPEQQEIVRRVEELFALANQLEARYAKAKAQIDRLVPSILAKAFRGELVPQNPSDEPASVLLARLRSAAPAAKLSRRKVVKKS
jgi:type I restriction enzyme S subunit